MPRFTEAPSTEDKEMGFFGLFRAREKNAVSVGVSPGTRGNASIIKPDNTPLYVKRRWVQNGNTYQGYYRTMFGAWYGEIVRRGDIFRVFIVDPPLAQLQKHSRWACFYDRSNKKWEINLAKFPAARDVDSIIFHVERIIMESYRI